MIEQMQMRVEAVEPDLHTRPENGFEAGSRSMQDMCQSVLPADAFPHGFAQKWADNSSRRFRMFLTYLGRCSISWR